jgi:hypothetical protein
MKKIENSDVLNAWIYTCVAITLIYVLVLDTFFSFIYSFFFSRARQSEKGINSSCLQVMSTILVGNGDIRARLSVCLEIKGKK